MSKTGPFSHEFVLSKSEVVFSKYAYLIKKISYRLLKKLPEHILIEDLMQAGAIGLLEALKNYDPSRQIPFEHFASFRIHGSIIDELRRESSTPRSAIILKKKIESTAHEISNKKGSVALNKDIAKELGMPVNAYMELKNKAKYYDFTSFEDKENEDLIKNKLAQDDFMKKIEIENLMEKIKKSIEKFPKKYKDFFGFYYMEQMTLKKIAEKMNLTEARVCQVNQELLKKIKMKFLQNKG